MYFDMHTLHHPTKNTPL